MIIILFLDVIIIEHTLQTSGYPAAGCELPRFTFIGGVHLSRRSQCTSKIFAIIS